MPERNPYGEPLPTADLMPVVLDRGPDPRSWVAGTLRVLGSWEDTPSYTLIADDVEQMHPDDPECALCGYIECQNNCPMMRWRGQS